MGVEGCYHVGDAVIVLLVSPRFDRDQSFYPGTSPSVLANEGVILTIPLDVFIREGAGHFSQSSSPSLAWNHLRQIQKSPPRLTRMSKPFPSAPLPFLEMILIPEKRSNVRPAWR